MPWHSYFIEAMPFTASAVPMLFVAARASGQPTRTHKPIICHCRRLYDTQGTGVGQKSALPKWRNRLCRSDRVRYAEKFKEDCRPSDISKSCVQGFDIPTGRSDCVKKSANSRKCWKEDAHSGHKHQSAYSRSSQKKSRLPHCESVGLGHGFTMDRESEEVQDGLVP